MVRIRPSEFPHIYTDERDIFTKNLVPGSSVYGEKLVKEGGIEYRLWDPRRSKLSALLHKGCKFLPLERKSKILYLGAASGTTASHLSDIAVEGTIFCVEISPRAFQKLVTICEERTNMMPILADANKPESYESYLGKVDILYQDIAQRHQASIFLKNMRFLKEEGIGYLMVKSRSIDVGARPEAIYRKVEKEMISEGVNVLDTIPLEPYEKDHAAIIVEKER